MPIPKILVTWPCTSLTKASFLNWIIVRDVAANETRSLICWSKESLDEAKNEPWRIDPYHRHMEFLHLHTTPSPKREEYIPLFHRFQNHMIWHALQSLNISSN